ncbi:MAG: hypothetical protein M3505_07580 [Verrucomicrobiota bacterium]|nr:hypothetical protein [Verrucomicrobiota bacterium]
MRSIIESGMTFGPYEDERFFYIEKSVTYGSIQEGVQMGEFLLLRSDEDKPPSIWIVEAKSSTPRPETQPNFDEFISEIRDKLANALGLGIASILKRHATADDKLPGLFKKLDLGAIGFRLILVINGHQKSWLPPLQEALRSALHATTQVWALGANAVVVINHEDARRFNLTSAP